MIVHNTNDLPGEVVVQGLHDWMVENFTQLLQTALGLRSAGRRLLLLSPYQCGKQAWVQKRGSHSTIEPPLSEGWRGDDSGVVALSLPAALGKANVLLDDFGRKYWRWPKREKTKWLVWDNHKEPYWERSEVSNGVAKGWKARTNKYKVYLQEVLAVKNIQYCNWRVSLASPLLFSQELVVVWRIFDAIGILQKIANFLFI